MSTWSLPPRYDELVRAVLAQDYINIELDSNRNQLIRVRSSRLSSLEAAVYQHELALLAGMQAMWTWCTSPSEENQGKMCHK